MRVLPGILLALLACSKEPESAQHRDSTVLEERVLLELKDGLSLWHRYPVPDDAQALCVSKATGNVACIIKRENEPGQRVFWKDKEGPTLEDTGIVQWSPDGRHIAFVAKRERRDVLVVDLVETTVTAKALSSPVWSPDSSAVAVGVAHGDADLWEEYRLGEKILRVPGKAGKHPSFSPSGKLSYAYMDQSYSTFIRVGEESLPVPKEFLIRRPVAFGKDDGDTLVAAARRGENRIGEVLLRKQVPASQEHRSIDSVGLSPGGTLWYVSTDLVGKELTYSLTVGARVFGPYRSAPLFVFSANGDAMAMSCVPVATGDAIVELAGRKIADEPAISELVVDSEFKRVAYVVVKGVNSYWLAVDGRTVSPKYDWIAGVRFSSDGKAISFSAKSGKRLLSHTQSLR